MRNRANKKCCEVKICFVLVLFLMIGCGSSAESEKIIKNDEIEVFVQTVKGEVQKPVAYKKGDQELSNSSGQPQLNIFKKTGEGVEQMYSRMVVKEGDVLQLQYDGLGLQHGMIISIDGRGVSTLHFPTLQNGSTSLKRGLTLLDFGFKLDGAPGFEQFFFITSTNPIDVKRVLKKVKESLVCTNRGCESNNPGRHDKKENFFLDLDEGLQQTDIVLYKRNSMTKTVQSAGRII